MVHATRKTKIIGTVGPAVVEKSMLMELAKAGMDVARLNFSHGTHAEFKNIITSLREISQELGRPIGILADIQGPKIRIGKLKGGQVELKDGAEVWIVGDGVVGGEVDGKIILPTIYKDFVKEVSPGHHILLDDGLMGVKAVEKTSAGLRCIVEDGGILKQNKGINVPEVPFGARSITDKDYGDILFCLEQGVDFIAMSFVRTAQEVRHLKSFIQSRNKTTLVIAKIEKKDALTNLEEIIDESDGILVARGDLAVEVGNEKVPVLQKMIVRKCNLRGKPVIIATQMLMSMVDSPRPSRAEASDVANAIVDGTDALMLSNETAVGKYPVESVQMMTRIVEEMEAEPPPQAILFNEWQLSPGPQLEIALLQGAVRLASITKAKFMVVVTQSGQSALLVSKCRPTTDVIAITASQDVYFQLALRWGVKAVLMPDMETLISQTAVFEAIGQRLRALNLVHTGDKLVITAGLPRLAHGSTNTIKVHQI